MYLFRLAMASLANRRFTAILTAFAIALSVCLLLAVERVRVEARNSFASTISGTDLIVGARSGSVNLLLYSVFRIGNATNNIRWDSYEHFAASPQVKWAIPISLGDSHRGYRVMGTNDSYFEHYQYGRKQNLELASLPKANCRVSYSMNWSACCCTGSAIRRSASPARRTAISSKNCIA